MKMTNKKYTYITIIIFISMIIGILLNKDRFLSKPATIHPYKHSFTIGEKHNFPDEDYINSIIFIDTGSTKFWEKWMYAFNMSYYMYSPYEISEIKRKETIYFYLILSGCKENENDCTVSFNANIKQPDNKIRYIKESFALYERGYSDMFSLGDQIIKLSTTEKSPIGKYKITYNITDHNAKKTITINKEFTLE